MKIKYMEGKKVIVKTVDKLTIIPTRSKGKETTFSMKYADPVRLKDEHGREYYRGKSPVKSVTFTEKNI